MQPNDPIERRFVTLTERRALAHVTANGRTLTGYAIVFNSLSRDLGGYREIILPEAVDRTLRESLDVLALLDHDPAKVIGRTSAGTLSLAKDATGLHVEIAMPDTSYAQDAIELVRRGDVSGMSFAFSVVRPNGERFEQRRDGMVRVISDMTIHEISLVSTPAYPATQAQIARAAAPSTASLRRRAIAAGYFLG